MRFACAYRVGCEKCGAIDDVEKCQCNRPEEIILHRCGLCHATCENYIAAQNHCRARKKVYKIFICLVCASNYVTLQEVEDCCPGKKQLFCESCYGTKKVKRKIDGEYQEMRCLLCKGTGRHTE